jgi:hypothetical protein
VLSAAGPQDEAKKSNRAAKEAQPGVEYTGFQAGHSISLSRAGQSEQVENVLKGLRQREEAGVFVSIDNFAYIAANQGRLDDAFALLEHAIQRRMTNVLWLAVDPWADPLRADPRFEIVIARMGVFKK